VSRAWAVNDTCLMAWQFLNFLGARRWSQVACVNVLSIACLLLIVVFSLLACLCCLLAGKMFFICWLVVVAGDEQTLQPSTQVLLSVLLFLQIGVLQGTAKLSHQLLEG